MRRENVIKIEWNKNQESKREKKDQVLKREQHMQYFQAPLPLSEPVQKLKMEIQRDPGDDRNTS